MNAENRRVAIVLNGPGRVGRQFAELLSEKRRYIQERTGFLPVLVTVVSRHGILCPEDLHEAPSGLGIKPEDIEMWVRKAVGPDVSVRDYQAVLHEIASVFGSPSSNAGLPGIVVEATPTDIFTGEPGLSHISLAMNEGFSAISLSKGPLVVAFRELYSLARVRKVKFKYSGAVAAALPTLDTALYSMAGADIHRIEAVLNGTTNFILNRMGQGDGYLDALKEAQRLGVAESDPTLDVEGYDSAAKLMIIANTLWNTAVKLSEIRREGITGLDKDEVVRLFREGTPVRLVARAERLDSNNADSGKTLPCSAGQKAGRYLLSVEPVPVPTEHPFNFLPGTSKAIRFVSKEMGEIVVSGGASDVLGAAAACMKDLIHILEEWNL